MNLTLEKLAYIRLPGECPFGLPITKGCRSAGDSVLDMLPGTENKLIDVGTPCYFVDTILEKFNAVDCDYGERMPGKDVELGRGSPMNYLSLLLVIVEWKNRLYAGTSRQANSTTRKNLLDRDNQQGSLSDPSETICRSSLEDEDIVRAVQRCTELDRNDQACSIEQ